MGLKSLVFSISLMATVSASAVWKGDVTSAYPSTVRIRVASSDCTAVVIAEGWLLTAGHCVEGGTKSRTMKIGLGESGSLKSFKVSRIYPHPGYRDGFFENPNLARARYDLALIHLANPVNAPSAGILATESGVKKALQQKMAFAVGYGRSGLKTTMKRMASLPATLTVADYIETNSNNLGQGICTGDSGGGLYVMTAQGPKVIGINSVIGRLKGASDKGEICGGANTIGVVASIYAEADWIQNTIGLRFSEQ